MTTESTNLPQAPHAGTKSSAGERPSLRERQHRRTYNDLLQATLDVIAERGVEQTTIQRITSRAGTSRATLYAYFPNGRDELYAQVYRMLGRGLIQRSERLASQQSDWVGRLCAYVQAMVELASQRQIGLFYNVTGPRLTEMKYQGGGSQRTLSAFTAELTEAQRSREIAEHLDVEAVAHLLVGAIREAGMHTSTDPPKRPVTTRPLNSCWRRSDYIRKPSDPQAFSNTSWGSDDELSAISHLYYHPYP